MFYRVPCLVFAASLTLTTIASSQTLKRPGDSPSPPSKQQKEEEPPEEDDSAKPKEYAFNPLQASKEIQVGDFYMKKGSLGAAIKRYSEATRWNPTSAEAYLKLGDAESRFKDTKAAKEAYSKYLELAPDAKNASAIKKKMAKM
jgi:tetratricopeptide (TPR) repeat protein